VVVAEGPKRFQPLCEFIRPCITRGVSDFCQKLVDEWPADALRCGKEGSLDEPCREALTLIAGAKLEELTLSLRGAGA